jgi:hypothetical protein
MGGDLVGAQTRPAVDRDAVRAPLGSGYHGYLQSARIAPDPPEGRRRVVAEDRRGPAGQHGDHPLAVPRHVRSPNRIDPPRQPVEAPDRDPAVDQVPAETEPQQLSPSHDPVLLPRERP